MKPPQKLHPTLAAGRIDQNKINHSGTTAHEIIRYLEDEIETLRKKNDKPLDEFKTAWLRGRIAENRTLLAKIKPNTDVSVENMSRS